MLNIYDIKLPLRWQENHW